jgi:hypothetical protein
VLVAFQFPNGAGVLGVAGNRALEDRGVRGDAAETVLGNQPPEFAAREEAAVQIIQPDRLPEPLQGFDPAHHHSPPAGMSRRQAAPSSMDGGEAIPGPVELLSRLNRQIDRVLEFARSLGSGGSCAPS